MYVWQVAYESEENPSDLLWALFVIVAQLRLLESDGERKLAIVLKLITKFPETN